MRIVFLTQQVDPQHPVLAATIPKLRALAELVDELVVLADRVVPCDLPENVRTAQFGSRLRAGRGSKFEALLARELARRPDAVLAHMIPLYAILAAPATRALGVRLLLWYTHWNRSAALRLAERAVDVVLSVDRRSFPIDSPKLVPIGHGIDTDAFRCVEARPKRGFQALSLGRYSEAKGLVTLLRAAALDPALRVVVHGPALSDAERRHRRELELLAGALHLDGRVVLGEPVSQDETRALLAESDVLVNNMRAGAADKVVLEAGASCVPVLASDPGWGELLDGLELPLRFGRHDADELARRLRGLDRAGWEARARLGAELRRRVVAGHSVRSWAEGVVEAAGG